MKFYILHGWGGDPETNWFPWLRFELDKLGHQVVTPKLPDPYQPNLSNWLAVLTDSLRNETEPVTLIGHSLGGLLILNYLHQTTHAPVSAAIFVASWGEDRYNGRHSHFTPSPFDFAKIRASGQRFAVISSTNDPYINTNYSQNLANNLHTDIIWIKNAGHLDSSAGFTTFPLLLDKIKQIL